MFKFKNISNDDLLKIGQMKGSQMNNEKFAFDGAGGSSTDLVMPHESYILGLSSLQSLDNPEAKASGVRVIDAADHNFKSIYDLVASGGDERKEPQMYIDKNFVKGYQAAFTAFLGSDMEGQNYEVRSLKVPALHVDAIWLHNQDDDVYIPVLSMGLFEDNKKYNKHEFFKKLKIAASDYDLEDNELGG